MKTWKCRNNQRFERLFGDTLLTFIYSLMSDLNKLHAFFVQGVTPQALWSEASEEHLFVVEKIISMSKYTLANKKCKFVWFLCITLNELSTPA